MKYIVQKQRDKNKYFIRIQVIYTAAQHTTIFFINKQCPYKYLLHIGH